MKDNLNPNKNRPLSPPSHKAPFSSILVLTIIQLIFFLIPVLLSYWFFTQNYQMLFLMVLISILQALLVKGRNERYVRFLARKMKVNQYGWIERIYEEEVLENQEGEKTLFCFHPHGVYGYGIMLNANHPSYQNEKLSRALIIGSNFALNLPIIGLHLRLWGITGADSANFKSLLSKGKTLSLLPGGYEEATLTTPHQFRIYIKQRKGFVKYALEYGYTIRQVLILHQHKAFHTFDHFLGLRLWLNRFKIPGVINWGPWGFFLQPNVRMTTVIGKGLRGRVLGKGEEPSKEEVEEFHERYVRELEEFYGRYRGMNQGSQFKIY